MLRFRALARAAVLGTVVLLSGLGQPPTAIGGETRREVTAYLDGIAIPLEEVSRYYCDDFSYPVINCSKSPLITATRATLLSLLAAVDYVTIYDFSAYSGSYMNVSQDYSVLALIGWNDKVGSFKARNSETGTFFSDWLYGGSQWSFCCNSQLGSLGGYDNTFSSIKRT